LQKSDFDRFAVAFKPKLIFIKCYCQDLDKDALASALQKQRKIFLSWNPINFEMGKA